MRILFIEDHPYKRSQIINFLKEEFDDIEIEIRESYNSGLKELILNYNKYDFLLLDISMPNYDVSIGESGGDFIPLAGKLILKEMYLREIPTRAIVVTMYENYIDGTSLRKLDESLRSEFEENYQGYVYFSVNNSEWKSRLTKLINQQL